MENAIANALGNVLIVGGGRMGRAIAVGILRIPGMDASKITIANPGQDKREALESELGVKTVASAAQGLPANCVIIAVKPKQVPDAIASLLEGGIAQDALVVSIAAGISTASISGMLGGLQPVVRVMPNTPLMVGHGMSAVSSGATASTGDCELVRELFACMGRAVIIEESQQDIACAVSGSGPAYYELFTQVISNAAVELGLPQGIALELALQTMLGTAELIEQTGQSLEAAIDAVSSPGGTTVAALDAMRASGIEDAISRGVQAAAARSKELGS